MAYTPHPIDTSELAKNTHEVWSAERIAQGWQYGETRSDAQKLHPCLIEYDELSDDEKTFDRNTAMETLKCIIKLGYTIEKK